MSKGGEGRAMNKAVFVSVVGVYTAVDLGLCLILDDVFRILARGVLSTCLVLAAPHLWHATVTWALRTIGRGNAALDEVLSVLERQAPPENH